MASSRMMSSSNSDRPVPPPPQPQSASTFSSISIPGGHQTDHHSKHVPSVTMDDILKNIYVDELSPDVVFGNGEAGGFGNKMTTATTTAAMANDVWKDMVAGTGKIGGGGGNGAGMTLEEYLSKTPAIGGNDEVVRFGAGAEDDGGMVVYGGGVESPSAMLNQFQPSHNGLPAGQGMVIGNGNGSDGRVKGKRKAVEEPVVDKATQQKQKRMIKNRESAARSRERKQQYINELEQRVMNLEEENAQLLKLEAEERNHRLQSIIENKIPVEESQRQPRRLRRTSSMEW